MLLSLKVAKKYMPVYCFHGKHFTCWDMRGMLGTNNFGQDSKQTSKTTVLSLKYLMNAALVVSLRDV